MMEHGVAEASDIPRVEEAEVVTAGDDEWREKASGVKCCDGRASGEISLPFLGEKTTMGW